MKIGGIQKCSLIDYPGSITAIIFTSGCNFHCPYCHNPELVTETATLIPELEIFAFLERRKHVLDAVTITGGEPTIHKDLIPFIQKIKQMGFRVKLDTNGTNPEVVEQLQKEYLVDYIAMDVKAPLASYMQTVARPVDTSALKKTIELLMHGEISYEFRTTVIKSLISLDDIREIGREIAGAKIHYLQKFVPTKTLNPAFLRKTTYSDSEFEEMRSIMSAFVGTCIVR